MELQSEQFTHRGSGDLRFVGSVAEVSPRRAVGVCVPWISHRILVKKSWLIARILIAVAVSGGPGTGPVSLRSMTKGKFCKQLC